HLTIDLAGHTIEVPIDRVEFSTQQEPQRVAFVRTRFGRSKSKPVPGTRDLFYLQARRQHHSAEQVELKRHNLSTGETSEIKMTQRKEKSLLDELTRALEGIDRRDFTPRPDPYVCPTCPFYLICPA